MTINKKLYRLAAIWAISTAPVFAASLPQDEDVAELYEYSCMACHASEHSGAPLAGDQKAWAPRVKQGMEQLLNNTIDGVRAMPALGSCSDCTEEDFEALINFMAGITQDNEE